MNPNSDRVNHSHIAVVDSKDPKKIFHRRGVNERVVHDVTEEALSEYLQPLLVRNQYLPEVVEYYL